MAPAHSPAHAPRILIVTTSHAVMGETGKPTGLWFEELAAPYYAFIGGGAPVTVASIWGGRVPLDPNSCHAMGEKPASVVRFLSDPQAMAALEGSLALSNVQAEDYDAVYLPGGHGTMWDLPNSAALAALLAHLWRDGKVVAAVCHGPAGLVGATDDQGRPLVAGRRVSAFTNSEEVASGLAEATPFLLETRLRELGANFEGGPDFQPYAVADGRLVTGQNPASSEEVARLVLAALKTEGQVAA